MIRRIYRVALCRLGGSLLAAGLALPVAFAHLPAHAEPAADAPTLGLSEVLSSVDRHHPKLASAGLDTQSAHNRMRAARGSFDLQLTAGGRHTLGGKYDETRWGVGVSQLTPLVGLRWGAGYENGRDFTVYDAKNETSRTGRLFASLELPLLAGREIDAARKSLWGRELDVISRELKAASARIEVRLAAVRAYLAWIRAGALRAIAFRLVDIARERQLGVEIQIESGALPALEAVDNRRLIATRREKLAFAEQKLAQAALELGLYRRDPRGQPWPPRGQRPESFPSDIEQLLRTSRASAQDELRHRPDLLAYDNALDKLGLELDYANNRALPKLNAKAMAATEFGDPSAYAPFATTQNDARMTVGLKFSLPLQRREALGEAAAARTDVRSIELGRQFARDKAALQLDKSWRAVEGASTRLALAEEARAAASELEEAERQRFADGLSNILTVNLREAAAASAGSVVIEAQHDYYLALATYRAAAARL